MPLDTSPIPDVILVPFQCDLPHGFAFELNATHLPQGLAPSVDLIDRGIALLHDEKPEARVVMAKLVARPAGYGGR